MTLKNILELGGKISIYNKGKTNNIGLTKLLKKNNISFEEEKCLIYLNYSKSPQIQVVYLVNNLNNEDEVLEEIYNKMKEK